MPTSSDSKQEVPAVARLRDQEREVAGVKPLGELWLTSGPGLPVGPSYLYAVLKRVLECPMALDENGHAFLKVPCRSLMGLGAVIGNIVRDEINVNAYSERSAAHSSANNEATDLHQTKISEDQTP